MEEIFISIIIPVYNAELYLERCIKSVISQTLEQWELILVDDGSTDQSPHICDIYCSMDKRIKVIHQKNAGVSAARNMGILNANGSYIGFVHSDDWLESNMYERLLKEAKTTDADVVMCDVMTVYDDGKTQVDTITQLSGNRILKKSDFTPSLILEMAGSACRCIYKNNRYNDKRFEHMYTFPVGIKFSEDRIFNLYALGQADKSVYIKESYYNRYVNKKSTVHSFHSDYFEAYKLSACEIEKAIVVAWENDPELKKAYLKQLVDGAMGAICNYYYKTSTLSRRERKKKVQALCNDEMLRSAIEIYGSNMKSQWILDKKYCLLILYAKLANWRHGR